MTNGNNNRKIPKQDKQGEGSADKIKPDPIALPTVDKTPNNLGTPTVSPTLTVTPNPKDAKRKRKETKHWMMTEDPGYVEVVD